MNTSPPPVPSDLAIVVVEDEPRLREPMVMALSHLGHRVRGVADGAALDAALRESPADVVVLDLGLPGEDGLAVARRLRRAWSGGIVMVTARSQVEERISGLDSGADLYFVKPVDFRELDAALRSLARRLPPVAAAWSFNSRTAVLSTPAGVAVAATAREAILLELLFASMGDTVARETISSALGYPGNRYADLRLERMISRLRAKVKTVDPANPLPIRARHNLGYAFLAEPVD